MKVSELIEKLKTCPQNLEVMIYYDGDSRLICDGAFLEKDKTLYNNDEDALDKICDVLVLCESDDVYNEEDYAGWFFKDKERGKE